jgi:hypothetical protein
MATPSLQVPGYDDNEVSDISISDDAPIDVPPLSNPLPSYKLLAYKYNSLDKLTNDLYNWAAQALFDIRKLRVNNKVEGFGYTRIDFYYLKDKVRPSRAITKRISSTIKTSYI